MPRLIIMCGYPFAGKSTVARQLTKRLQLIRVALDDINTELGIGIDLRQPITKVEWQRSYDVYHQRINENLKAGRSVIVDTVAYKRDNRDQLRQLAILNGSTPIVLFVNTPLDEVKKRWLTNRETRERTDVRDDNFYEVTNGFEAPKRDESPLVIAPNTSIEDVIKLLG